MYQHPAKPLTPDATHRRRGSIYIMVLGTSTAMTVIGLSALLAVRIERRGAEGTADLSKARFHARSAIEMGLFQIGSDLDWRTNQTNGNWYVDKPISTGTFTLEGVDPNDGDLGNNDTDPLVFTGIGTRGDALYSLQVTLTAEVRPLSCLEVALHANNDLLIMVSSFITSDQTISANNIVDVATSAIANADVEAVNGITGPGTINGTSTTGITPRAMPDSTVFDFYLDPANATAIDINAIPSPGGTPTISDVVISPISNPYGASLSPNGVYVINCAGQDIYIQNCRIVGTLVLLNPGSISDVLFAVNWEPAVINYPALLVSGDMRISLNNAPLSETTLAVNFNPPGTPYEGVQDTNTTQSYPSVLKGLIYVSGDLTTTVNPVFDGAVVVGGAVNVSNALDLTYQPTFLNNPPPGFTAAPRMVVTPDSWRQVVN